MAEPNVDSTNICPIVMRWIETVFDGKRHWYLASLHDDASFWGYVHIRTNSLNENRSFDGRIDKPTYNKIRSLVDSVDVSDFTSKEPCDGSIGFGSLADFIEIIRHNSESSDFQNAETFRAIVDLLQFKLIAAAKL